RSVTGVQTCALPILAFLLGGAFQLQAGTFAQTVTLSKKDIALEEIFKEIKKQTGYNVISSSDALRGVPKLDVNEKGTQLTKMLRSEERRVGREADGG